MWARIPVKGEKIGEEGLGLNGDLADLRSEALLWQDTQSARQLKPRCNQQQLA
jgi:hypothetical protein